MELSVVTSDGNKSASLAVSDATFGAAFNESLVHQVVVAYLAGARAGTRGQKNRSAVSGGGRKPWRQKGTGRARAGTIRSPLWRGGGKIFPATTQDFSQKVNRKMYRAAMRAILSELVRQDRLLVCDDLDVAEPKTKALTVKLATLGVHDALIVGAEINANLGLSARNVKGVEVCEVRDIDPVSLIGHERVIMTSGAVKHLEEWLQ